MNQSDNQQSGGARLGRLLPERIDGWSAKEPAREFDRDDLFDLIDGGAEVYRSLNVKKVLNRVYSKDGDADIFVDLFDMGSSYDAFGAYHHDVREKADAGVGQESEYQGGSLYFWRDSFFLSIVALAETPQTKSAVMTLGKEISKAIGKDGETPKLLTLLPKAGLQKQHLYFFHDAETLSRRYLVGDDNPLILSTKTDGLLAMYRIEDAESHNGTAVFLAVAYEDKALAKAALDGLFRGFFNTKVNREVFERGENKWAGARVSRGKLFGVLEASTRSLANSLLDEAVIANKK